MPQSFFLVQLGGIKGPMTSHEVFNCHSGGQIHDCTPVWDSLRRSWYQFAELKLPVVMKLRPKAVMRRVEVAWAADCRNP
ncbi:hypothetical protein SBV1_2150016 [Verrucomicrobia bacterium]|nr:hypothetical protein SBV1_2150016 [Verrucomicrobiota bacterium]